MMLAEQEIKMRVYGGHVHLAEARRTVNVRSPIFNPLRAAQAMSITEGS